MSRRNRLPGYGLSLGVTLTWLSLIVLVPLGGLFLKSASIGWDEFARTLSDPQVISAFRVSFSAAFVAAGAFTALGLASAFVAVALDFAAGFGLEAAEAAFAAGFVSDGALAINSPTPRWTRA